MKALGAAAMDGVDVRMLLPRASDLPVLRTLSRAGYRMSLESGVRIFEWNGPAIVFPVWIAVSLLIRAYRLHATYKRALASKIRDDDSKS